MAFDEGCGLLTQKVKTGSRKKMTRVVNGGAVVVVRFLLVVAGKETRGFCDHFAERIHPSVRCILGTK